MSGRIFFQGCKVYLTFEKLQCNSDTSYPCQNSQLKNTVPNKTAVISYTCHKSQGFQVPPTSDQLAANSGVFTILLGSMIHQNDSKNSGKCYSYNYTFIIKDTNQDQPKEETHRMRSGRVLNVEIPCLLSAASGHVTLLAYQCVN